MLKCIEKQTYLVGKEVSKFDCESMKKLDIARYYLLAICSFCQTFTLSTAKIKENKRMKVVRI